MSIQNIAVKVTDLSKSYQIYENPIDRFKQMLFQGRKQLFKEFWAIKNVTFEVKRGETVGIIGSNGSGKSTLLQMICGTLNQTSGSIEVNGRISALLELGSGFNPEFTGKDNVYLNASIMGLTKNQIDERYDEILAFSEIGDFINQPVKIYSSGMLVRLAFSVAISVDPDILIVDEALSVGDERFQHKCYSHIRMLASKGVTILFVTHSASQIIDLCDKAVLLDTGEFLGIGKPKEVVNFYRKLINADSEYKVKVKYEIKNLLGSLDFLSFKESYSDNKIPKSDFDFYDPSLVNTSKVQYLEKGVRIKNCEIRNDQGFLVNNLIKNKFYEYTYDVDFDSDVHKIRFGMIIKSISGVELSGATTAVNSSDSIMTIKKGSTVRMSFKFKNILNAGVYFTNSGISSFQEDGVTHLHRVLDAYCFRVIDDAKNLSTGIVDLEFSNEILIK